MTAEARVETDAARRRLLNGAGEMRALLRSSPMQTRPVGPVKSWPRALLGAMRMCLESPTPTWLIWDPHELLLLYNDAAAPLLGGAHPDAFGAPAARSGAEILEAIAPGVEGVLASGRPRRLADQLLMLARNGRTEERYFDMLITAVFDGGDAIGVLCVATDTTAGVQAARRSAVLTDIAVRTADAPNEHDAWCAAVAALERDPADLPYVVLYAADGAGEAAHLCGAVGLSAGSGRAPSTIEPSAADAPWPIGEVGRTLEPVAAQEAMICPLTGPGGGLCGYLVAGLSPRLPMDEAYRAFLTAAAERIAAGVAAARAREEHARRQVSLERGRVRLEQRCAELTRLYEHAPVPIIVVRGRRYVVERINAAALRSSTGKKLLDQPLFEALPELVDQGFEQRLAAVLDTGQPDIGREVAVRLESGGKVEDMYFTFISAPFDAQRHDDPRIIVVAMDVTEQVRARSALEASEARYRHIFNSIDVSIWEEDFSGVLPALEDLTASGVDDLGSYFRRRPEFLHEALRRVAVLDVNESTLRLFGADDKRELTRSVRKLFLPESWHAFAAKLEAIATGQKSVRIDTVAKTLQGERRDLMMTAAPAEDVARSGRALVTLTDITERKRMEETLREADRQKDEFLATLAHELRNPLAPLRSGVDLLRAMPEQAPPEVLDIVERQVDHLARLANDLFESSRIRRGSYDLRKERVELVEVLQDAVEASGALIRASGHQLEMRMPEKPLWIDGDRTRLAQIFVNLLNNAARYTMQPGRITVSAEQAGDDAQVEVSDTGIGIPPEAMAELFTMFARFGRDEDASVTGLGVGLALAKQLTEMHGGTIEARSEGAGKGSTFIVHLPLADIGQPLAGAEDGAALSIEGRRLLVVEDDRDTAESLKLILEANGADVRVAANGPKALASFASFEPDVVLLDIGLPGMSGYEVARRLRAEFPSRRALIVALTGWGREEDVRRALEGGFDDHLVKPVEIGALRRLLGSAGAASK